MTATPGSTYLARGYHNANSYLYDYDDVYPYRIFYYDNWFYSSFESRGLDEPWYYSFFNNGFRQFVRRPQTIKLGATYSSAVAVVSAVTPHIDSLSPNRGAINATTTVTIQGSGFKSSSTVNAGSGITTSIERATSTSLTVKLSVSSNAAEGNRGLTVKTGGKTSNSVNFYVQVPRKLLPYNVPNLAPDGIGPLKTPVNENVTLLQGQPVYINACGVYRSYIFSLADQEGVTIHTTFTLDELFSNINSSPGLPAITYTPTTFGPATEAIEDLQFVGFIGGCLQNNEFQTFTQKFKITINGTAYFPTTTINIRRGNEGGVLKVDRTITAQ